MPRLPARLAPLLLLLLLPLLAHADPSWGSLDGLVGLALLVAGSLLVLLVLTLVLTVLSYQRPERRGLYIAQLVLLGLNALAGLVLLSVARDISKLVPLTVNPFWELVLPLGCWLNGVRWARQAQTDTGRRNWVALAVVSLLLLLGLLPYQLLNTWLAQRHAGASDSLVQVVFVAVAAALTFGSWFIVTRQLRADVPATTWQPWWLPPLPVAVLSAAHSVFTNCLRFAFIESYQLPPALYLRIGGQALLLSWVLGVLALLVLRPGRVGVGDTAA